MIHDLYYPKNEETSVNAYIPRQFCAVTYEDLDVVIAVVVEKWSWLSYRQDRY